MLSSLCCQCSQCGGVEFRPQAERLPRPEDLVAGIAMAEHEGAVYEDSMVRNWNWQPLFVRQWGPWCD